MSDDTRTPRERHDAPGVILELASAVSTAQTDWRAAGSPDDDQGVAEWFEERTKREQALDAALQRGVRFDAELWQRETRRNLIELAALCIAQVESLDRAR